jgi:very-short-patch-repair endonuclease
MDDALRRGLTSIDRLKAETIAMNGSRRTGAATFRRLVSGRDHRDAEVRSQLETRVLRLLDRIAQPVADYRVSAAGRTYYLDFAYPDLKLAIECQGIRWHLGEEAFKNDMTRHRHLSAAGWLVLFVCWDDVVFNRDQLEDEIRAARRNRDALIRPALL